jgi:hypothetical protein
VKVAYAVGTASRLSISTCMLHWHRLISPEVTSFVTSTACYTEHLVPLVSKSDIVEKGRKSPSDILEIVPSY